ncbi:MAG: transglycosylase domain-containing protein [Endomicrobiales bacterium]|nr:transglycosylase domain-containing protein [Endomicrobiales bacterium]
MNFQKKLPYIVFILALSFVLGSAAYLRSLFLDMPSIATLEDYTPSLITKVYDRKGELITELFTEHRVLTPLKEIPVDLQNAVLAIEDKNFFRHWGVSPKGIARAAVNNVVKRRVAQGGSTITQQLAKTIFLTPERTISRKLKELLLTFQLERNYSKEEILQLYMNQIYFGSGAYGVESAAKIYFSKHVKDLNLPECAMLAGLPRAPNYYSPFRNADRAVARRATVLRRMQELGFITEEEEGAANAYPVNSERMPVPAAAAPYFIEYVRLQLEPKYGSQMIYRGGLSIYTTLDLQAQLAAEKALGENLTAFDAERMEFFETNQSTPIKVQGGLIAIDPKTGGIRAMIGGRDFRESQFNRAIQAKRQPGSAFKPFVYTAALENGFTPVSVIVDEPLVYVNDGRDWRLQSRTTEYLQTLPPEWIEDPLKVWVPENYGKKYHGRTLLRSALEHSLNMCAIEVLDQIGPMRAVEYAKKMGITSPLTNTLSLALGSSGVTLMELVSALAVLDSGGIKTTPYAVVRIENKDGRILEENFPKEEEVLPPQLCYVVTNLLRGVVEHGTGRAARAVGRPCAGKTGTTNDFSDAWFVGFTPQLVAGVWVGYDEIIPLGDKMTGGRVACPIWTTFMREALKDEPVLNFKPPEDIVFALVDPKTGLLAQSNFPGAYLEAFIKGTEPKEYFIEGETELEDELREIPGDEGGF